MSIDIKSLGACPVPIRSYEHVLLGHGSGGRMSADLIQDVFISAFKNDTLSALEDQATLDLSDTKIAFTTDSYVVKPIFFPGGDIGKLAVHGTINDLAVGGAIPRFMSAAFILEEGFPIAELKRIVASMQAACGECGVALVTGDTKVVDKGKGDKVFITTSGIGLIPKGIKLSISSARPGDKIVVSGTMGDHGLAIMSVREGLEFETQLCSDTAPLAELIQQMLRAAPEIRCMRDPTRGGLASATNELGAASRVGVKLIESKIPIRTEVKSACEMLGLDPLYAANEGKVMAVVASHQADALVQAMRQHPLGKNSSIIGEIVSEHTGIVTLKSIVGGERVVTMLSGEQLPRIC